MQRRFAVAGASGGTGGKPRSSNKWVLIAGLVLLLVAIPAAYFLGHSFNRDNYLIGLKLYFMDKPGYFAGALSAAFS